MKNRCHILLFLVLSGCYGANLSAQTTVSDTSKVKERIAYIQNALQRSATPVDVWWYGWLGAYSAATVAQGAVALSSNELATRQDMGLGACTTILGAALQLATPIHTGKDARYLATLPDSTQEQKLKKLAMAESLLKGNALKEKAGRSWQIHALNEAVNLGSGLITWLAFKRTVWDGVENFLINSAITEAQIWTQPTKTIRDYTDYSRRYKNENDSVRHQPVSYYYMNAYPGGFSIGLAF
jgi:hypothetical protein